MNTTTNSSINQWKNKTIFLFLIGLALLINPIKAQIDFEGDLDSLYFENYENFSEAAFVSSTLGNVFTPKGDLRILVIYAGFTNDNNLDTGGVWPYDDGIRPPGKSFPTNINETFYTNVNQFSPSNTDKSVSNYY